MSWNYINLDQNIIIHIIIIESCLWLNVYLYDHVTAMVILGYRDRGKLYFLKVYGSLTCRYGKRSYIGPPGNSPFFLFYKIYHTKDRLNMSIFFPYFILKTFRMTNKGFYNLPIGNCPIIFCPMEKTIVGPICPTTKI